ncbi:MAG TPA: hypothetical protein VF188_14775 [Longimicrobiales bacterium]
MHTEHLENIRPGWVAAGWLVAAAMTSLIGLVLAALQLIGAGDESDQLWALVIVAFGFWVGGFFTGFRALRAPILHGIAIGLATLVAWFALNLLSLVFPDLRWQALTPTVTAALLLIQMATAVAGAWVGHRIALRGTAELQA